MDVTERVSAMYAEFPYPSPQGRRRNLKELANLLGIFSRETGYTLEGKSVLDAGTGTGHRLIEAAVRYRHTQFTAVDISDVPLSIARQAASNAGATNISFRKVNILEDNQILGRFDMVLSMGVVHHLADPVKGVRNLVQLLREDGVIFFYIYGKHGSSERLRRKQIVSLLLQGQRDLTEGISLVKELGFHSAGYGWNIHFDDEESRDALIVDSYLNVHEVLFDIDGIFDLLRCSGLHAFLVYGVVCGDQGRLFDTRLSSESQLAFQKTDPSPYLSSAVLQDRYRQLCLADQYRLLDLLYQPAGYTVMGLTAGAMPSFSADRIRANMLLVRDL